MVCIVDHRVTENDCADNRCSDEQVNDAQGEIDRAKVIASNTSRLLWHVLRKHLRKHSENVNALERHERATRTRSRQSI
jgi:hypothetical protein